MNHLKMVVFFFHIILILCLSSYAAAAPANSYGLTPAIYEAELSPGRTATFELAIVNQSNKTISFRMYTTGLSMDQFGRMTYPDEKGQSAASNWVEIVGMTAASAVNVDPNNNKVVKINVKVPSGTKPGQYFASIFAEPVNYTTTQGGNAELQTRIRVGSIVKISVPGPESSISVKCTAAEPIVGLPSKERVQALSEIVHSLDRDQMITDSNEFEVTKIIHDYGEFFDYPSYRQMTQEEKQNIAKQIRNYLDQCMMQELAVKIGATLKSESRVIVAAKGEAFVYQLINNETTKVKRLRDRFTLTPIGSDTRDQCPILPSGLRSFEGQVQRPLIPGDYSAEIKFSYVGEGSKAVKTASVNVNFTVTDKMAQEQKEMLVLYAEPEVLNYNMIPGQSLSQAIKIENLDLVDPIEIQLATDLEWLNMTPRVVTIAPGRTATIRVTIKVPKDESVINKNCKIIITPNKGKIVWIDVKVNDKKKAPK